MIFYFTGTGNSLAAARAIAEKGEQLVSITDAKRMKSYTYVAAEGEAVGFVYPEYCSTVCRPMQDFVRKLTLHNATYVYAVVSNAGPKAKSQGLLKKLLAERGITLSRAFHVQMPDNCIILLPTPTPEAAGKMLKKADAVLKKIRGSILNRETEEVPDGSGYAIRQKILRLAGRTKPFRVNSKCIGCGLCAKNCPDRAIRIADKKPVWVKKYCAMCTACINRCPMHAIEYGRLTKRRQRYVHPILKGSR